MIWLTALLLATVFETNPRQLELSSQDRFVLLSGLRREIGGSFIVSGLADADRTCTQTGACISAQAVAAQARESGVADEIRSPAELLGVVSLGRSAPIAIVSLRTARWLKGGNLQVVASVFDNKTGQWSYRSAVLENVSHDFGNRGVNSSGRRLRSWTELEVDEQGA